MRVALLNEIDGARRRLGIADETFRPLPFTTNWHKLEEKIYARFCNISGRARPIWLWERFVNEYLSLSTTVWPSSILHHLVPAGESLLFMVSDGSRFLFYEGSIDAFERILEELTGKLDEYYVLNKKRDWMLCVNHHDVLIGTGDFAVQQLRAFAERFPELLTPACPA